MERSRHASHLASRSYRGGIPDLGGGDEAAGAGAGAGGGGVGAAVSASAMARVSRHEETGRRDSGRREAQRGADRRRQRGGVGCSRSGRDTLDANAVPFFGWVGCQSCSANSGRATEGLFPSTNAFGYRNHILSSKDNIVS